MKPKNPEILTTNVNPHRPRPGGRAGARGRKSNLPAVMIPEHPRLILTHEKVEEIRRNVSQDPASQGWLHDLHSKGNGILAEGDLEYERVVRGAPAFSTYEFLNRIALLSLLWKMEGDRRHLERAQKDLIAVCCFPDWLMADKSRNLYFLLTGPMTMATALAYDWLYNDLDEGTRTLVRDAILQKGWQPMMASHRSGDEFPMKVHHNHATIPNCGLGLATLALQESLSPVDFDDAMGLVKSSLRHVLETLEPDGGYEEGVWYWRFGFGGLPLLISSMRTACQPDDGLFESQGLRETGYFPMYLRGTSGSFFNFADSPPYAEREDNGGADLILMLGAEFNNPHFCWFNSKMMQEPTAWTLMGDRPELRQDSQLHSLPLDRLFRGTVPVASFRSAWNDLEPDPALYVAFKGGRATVNHGDMDAGTFVLDALGVRWICDLGWDEPYPNVPGFRYWDTAPLGARWRYYKKRAEGHNLAVIQPDGRDGQDVDVTAPILQFKSTPNMASAVVDLTDIYQSYGAIAYQRSVAIVDGRTNVVLEDTLKVREASDICWFFHTEADIRIQPDGQTALLARNFKQLRVEFECSAPFVLKSMTADPLPQSPRCPGQAQSRDAFRKIALFVQGVTKATLKVRFVPMGCQ